METLRTEGKMGLEDTSSTVRLTSGRETDENDCPSFRPRDPWSFGTRRKGIIMSQLDLGVLIVSIQVSGWA